MGLFDNDSGKKRTIVKYGIVFSLLLLVAILIGCSSTATVTVTVTAPASPQSKVTVTSTSPSTTTAAPREPTESQCLQLMQNLMVKDKAVRIVSVKRIDSFQTDFIGTTFCCVKVSLDLECLISVQAGGGGVGGFTYLQKTAPEGGQINYSFPNQPPSAGQRTTIVGYINFKKTNKGWLADDGNIY